MSEVEHAHPPIVKNVASNPSRLLLRNLRKNATKQENTDVINRDWNDDSLTHVEKAGQTQAYATAMFRSRPAYLYICKSRILHRSWN